MGDKTIDKYCERLKQKLGAANIKQARKTSARTVWRRQENQTIPHFLPKQNPVETIGLSGWDDPTYFPPSPGPGPEPAVETGPVI